MKTVGFVLALGVASGGAVARAGVNDPNCHPTAQKPYPVVLVHGRSGHVTDMLAISNALIADGYCVYGADYGLYDGQTGLDHLTVSGGQLRTFVQQVLAMTGAPKVDAVGYSEGTGVIQDFILGKGGAAQVHRVVSFGGLQHPYGHVGASGFADSDLFLPNLLVTARKVDPNISAQQVITTAINVYAGAGGQIAGIDRAVATSPFASDLFDPVYWTNLHGGLSEPDGVYIRLASSTHSLPTKDRGIGVCYTNIVSTVDPITGASAGFQEPGDGSRTSCSSRRRTTARSSDAGAIAKMRAGLMQPCASDAGADPGGGGSDSGSGDDGGDGSGSDGSGDGAGGDDGGLHSGCSAAGAGSSWPALAVFGLVLVARGRRRRRS